MKNVLITGGTRGIGRATSELFAKNLHRVFIIYKDSDELARELEQKYGIIPYKADISKPIQVENVVNDIIEKFKHIDALINNAGISENSLFNDISYKSWENMLDTNLSSVFYTTKACVENMISRKSGKIVNVSSIWGNRGASCESHYAVSKAGVEALTKSLARELGPSNINVNAVACGMIDTDMTKCYTENEIKQFVYDLPLMRIGKAENVAKLIYFLASEDSNYITGQIINIDGGYSA